MMKNPKNNTVILERRLRPVYDSLDLGNNKKAIQEVDKVLKKNPDLQCGRALKALAFLRMSREKEAQIIIDSIILEKPYEDSTLQVLTWCYKENKNYRGICNMYKNAVSQNPNDEELLSHYFMSYIRINDFNAQQTTALQLYKIRPKNPYYFWAVMSVVLQALRGPDSKNSIKRMVLLALAQRMVDKLIAEDKLNSGQDVQLYLNILEYQKKYAECLEFLEGPVCTKLYPSAPVSIKINLLKNLNRWTDLNKLMKELLLQERDRWDYYKEYLQSSLELIKVDDQTEGTDYNVELCYNFLCQLIENGRTIRGPYLGRLELHRLMRENNMPAIELMGDYSELLVEYFRLFGDTNCCVNDLRMFIEYLEPYKRPGLASRFLEECGTSATKLPANIQEMRKHICSLQVSRICGAHSDLSVEHMSGLYTVLSLHYEHGMSEFGKNLLTTDFGPSDLYSILAVHLMYDLAMTAKSSNHLIEALCLLDNLLSNSPSNFHAKLLCLQIYNILGCGLGAHKTYESLDIKHIQLDSLGYLYCSHLPIYGSKTRSKYLYDQTISFFTKSDKESLEYLLMSYKFGSFIKIEEFMDFRERLSNSLHFSLTSVEALLMELVGLNTTQVPQSLLQFQNMQINPEEDNIKWDELSDNRDLTILLNWNPLENNQKINENEGIIERLDQLPPTQTEIQLYKDQQNTIETESFAHDKELLKLRSLLLRLIASSVNVFTTAENENNLQTLVKLKNEWSSEFQRIKNVNYTKATNKYLVNLLPSRLFTLLHIPYESFFNNFIEFNLNLFNKKTNKNAFQQNSIILIGNLKIITELLCNKIIENNESVDMIWDRLDVQETITCCLEILSLTVFVLSICHEKYSPTSNILISATSGTTKKNKKKDNLINGATMNSELTGDLLTDKDRQTIIADILNEMKANLTECERVLDTWKTPIFAVSLTENMELMSLNPKVEALVSLTFRENHNSTLRDLKGLIKDKIKMISKQ